MPIAFGFISSFYPDAKAIYPPVGLLFELGVGDAEKVAEINFKKFFGEFT